MSHELGDITLTVTFRGASHTVILPNHAPLSALHSRLELLTSVPPSFQKLIHRGKKIQHRQDDSDIEPTISQAGLHDGVKVQMLGSTVEELGQLNAADSAHQKKEQILRERALKPQVKVCPHYVLIIKTANHDERRLASFDGVIVYFVTPVPLSPYRTAHSFAAT